MNKVGCLFAALIAISLCSVRSVHAAQLVVANSGECIDVPHGVTDDGTQIIIVACNGRPSQQWSILKGQIVGSGGKCIDTSGGGMLDHTPLILATCSSAPSQQWTAQ